MESHTSDRVAERRERLLSAIVAADLDALLVTSEINVRYLTGFTGDSTYLLLGRNGKPLLVTDRRYETQVAEECGGLEAYIRPPEEMLTQATASVIQRSREKNIGFESAHVSFSLHQALTAACCGCTLAPTNELVETLRAVKDADEIWQIRDAVQQAITGFEAIQRKLHPAQTERELALELERELRNAGARGFGFEPIIGVGDRSALPHYHAAERKISDSPLVLFDWGAETHSLYRSDLTRTVFTGKPTDEMRQVFAVVYEAQRRAIAAIRPGVAGSDIDAIARGYIADSGYGAFSHGLGHGFGLQIHERPRLGPNFDHVLTAGMVVTVEPGIYIRGQFGVRIEDDVLVTPEGCEVLSAGLPNDWESAQLAF
jgi:Xaa-Pro aminopeptidase